MTKRNKKQQQSDRCSLLECEVRPVTKSDKWCERRKPKNQEVVGDAPFGYIIAIPYCPKQNVFLDNVDGYIIRSKKHCGQLLLQVVKKGKGPQYGVKSSGRKEPNTSKKEKKQKKTVPYSQY